MSTKDLHRVVITPLYYVTATMADEIVSLTEDKGSLVVYDESNFLPDILTRTFQALHAIDVPYGGKLDLRDTFYHEGSSESFIEDIRDILNEIKKDTGKDLYITFYPSLKGNVTAKGIGADEIKTDFQGVELNNETLDKLLKDRVLHPVWEKRNFDRYSKLVNLEARIKLIDKVGIVPYIEVPSSTGGSQRMAILAHNVMTNTTRPIETHQDELDLVNLDKISLEYDTVINGLPVESSELRTPPEELGKEFFMLVFQELSFDDVDTKEVITGISNMTVKRQLNDFEDLVFVPLGDLKSSFSVWCNESINDILDLESKGAIYG